MSGDCGHRGASPGDEWLSTDQLAAELVSPPRASWTGSTRVRTSRTTSSVVTTSGFADPRSHRCSSNMHVRHQVMKVTILAAAQDHTDRRSSKTAPHRRDRAGRGLIPHLSYQEENRDEANHLGTADVANMSHHHHAYHCPSHYEYNQYCQACQVNRGRKAVTVLVIFGLIVSYSVVAGTTGSALAGFLFMVFVGCSGAVLVSRAKRRRIAAAHHADPDQG